jgi:hypothetical protein
MAASRGRETLKKTSTPREWSRRAAGGTDPGSRDTPDAKTGSSGFGPGGWSEPRETLKRQSHRTVEAADPWWGTAGPQSTRGGPHSLASDGVDSNIVSKKVGDLRVAGFLRSGDGARRLLGCLVAGGPASRACAVASWTV